MILVQIDLFWYYIVSEVITCLKYQDILDPLGGSSDRESGSSVGLGGG